MERTDIESFCLLTVVETCLSVYATATRSRQRLQGMMRLLIEVIFRDRGDETLTQTTGNLAPAVTKSSNRSLHRQIS